MPTPIRSIQAHQGWLRGLAVSHDGTRIASCGNDRMVRIWSAGDGQLIRELPRHPNIPYCVQFVRGSYDVVSGDIVGNIIHWRAEDGVQVRQLDLQEIFSHVGDIAPFGGVINLSFSRKRPRNPWPLVPAEAGHGGSPQANSVVGPRA